MKLPELTLALAIGAAVFTNSAIAGPDTSTFRTEGFPTRVTTKEQAMKCCLPKEKVALACKDCKTVTEKPGEEKKGILGWFKADSTHGCSGCGAKITVRQISHWPEKQHQYQRIQARVHQVQCGLRLHLCHAQEELNRLQNRVNEWSRSTAMSGGSMAYRCFSSSPL